MTIEVGQFTEMVYVNTDGAARQLARISLEPFEQLVYFGECERPFRQCGINVGEGSRPPAARRRRRCQRGQMPADWRPFQRQFRSVEIDTAELT